jgi:hypothetical protein
VFFPQLLASNVLNPASIDVQLDDIGGLEHVKEEMVGVTGFQGFDKGRWVFGFSLPLESQLSLHAHLFTLLPPHILQSRISFAAKCANTVDVPLTGMQRSHVSCVQRLKVLKPLSEPGTFCTTLWRPVKGVLFYGPPGTGVWRGGGSGGRAGLVCHSSLCGRVMKRTVTMLESAPSQTSADW